MRAILSRVWLFAGFVFLPMILGMAFAAGTSPNPKELLNAGKVDQLVLILQDQLKRSPNDAESHNFLCRTYFMMEEWDHAIAECSRAVELDPQQSDYHLWLGRSYGEKADRSSFMSAPGLAKKARAELERAVQSDPKNVPARMDLGEFYAEAPGFIGGGKDKARQQADALMPLNPAMGHWVLARVAEKEKQPDVAEREYRAEIAASHSGAKGWLDLANFLKYAQRYKEMEEALTKMDSSPVDRPEAIMHGGSLLLRAEYNFPLALRLLRRYLADGPVEEGPAFRAHAFLAEVLEKQGNSNGAAEEYRAALALFQNYPRAKDGLKRLGH